MVISWGKINGKWEEVIRPVKRRIFPITPNQHTHDAVRAWGFQVEPENLWLFSDGSMVVVDCVLLKDFIKCVPLPNKFVHRDIEIPYAIIMPYDDRAYFGEDCVRL